MLRYCGLGICITLAVLGGYPSQMGTMVALRSVSLTFSVWEGQMKGAFYLSSLHPLLRAWGFMRCVLDECRLA